MALPPPSGIVTLLTDFGSSDPYVGIMTGAVLRAHRQARVVDLCHEVPPQDIETGAFFLGASIRRFPDGTVHLAVVDPGVGTGRRLLAVAAGGAYYVAPDNGLLTPALELDAVEVRVIDLESISLRPESRTFHGRDLIGPIGGALSCGTYGFRALGPRVEDAVRLPCDPAPRVLFADRFGNLITNITSAQLTPTAGGLRIGKRAAPLVSTYGVRGRGELVSLVNSFGTLEVAVVEGSAYDLLGVGRGTPVELLEDSEGER